MERIALELGTKVLNLPNEKTESRNWNEQRSRESN